MLLLFPVLSKAFNVAMLNPHLLGWVWGLSFAPTLIIQIYKAIKFRNEDKEDKTV
jgi:Ca2+-transporting ATPase